MTDKNLNIAFLTKKDKAKAAMIAHGIVDYIGNHNDNDTEQGRMITALVLRVLIDGFRRISNINPMKITTIDKEEK